MIHLTLYTKNLIRKQWKPTVNCDRNLVKMTLVPNGHVFENLVVTQARCQTRIQNYLLKECLLDDPRRQTPSEYLAFQEPFVTAKWPKICNYEFLNEEDLKALLSLKRKRDIRKFIDKHVPANISRTPCKILFEELVYNVFKFCRMCNFDLKQTDVVLSQFYLTHIYFTSSYNICAEKLYLFFKELMLCHATSFPPDSIKFFAPQEIQQIMKFFCKIYLINLPLIRAMFLPNFAFYYNFFVEPEIFFKKPKSDKGKKKK